MASLLEPLESCILYAVCSCLDPRSLGSAEAAGFDRSCVVECWKAFRVAAEQQLISWPWFMKPLDQPALPTNNKHALREVTLHLKRLVRLPETWKDSIRKLSETVIEIQPRPAESVSTIGELRHGGSDDYAGPSSVGGREFAPPAVAAVPLSIGGCRRDTFAVGVQLVSTNLGCVGEAFLLGAECLTVRDGLEQVYTVCFSPISGRVFIRLPGGASMVALGLPDFMAGADATEVASLEMGGIEAFMFVSTSVGILFGRRRTDGSNKGNVEWCGELPAEFFPRLSLKKYASLTFQIDKLLETAQISIMSAGQLLPLSAALPTSWHKFDSIWRSYEW